MAFYADKQTLEDLNLLGKYKTNSIYSLFNKVQTAGGERLLDYMFRHPLSDVSDINRRTDKFQFFGSHDYEFPFTKEEHDTVENYLSAEGGGNMVVVFLRTCRRKFLNYIGLSQEYRHIRTGLESSVTLLNKLKEFISRVRANQPNPFTDQLNRLNDILESNNLKWLKKERNKSKFSLIRMARYDYLLKHVLNDEMKEIFHFIYEVDVVITVSKIGRSRAFSYAKALEKEDNYLQIDLLYHPALTNAIANSVVFDEQKNVLFLTGANMAGKSTFMKSFGITIYLAHMGFPVPAHEMTFSVKDGIYSSINVSDNLGLGISHFYAEVLRVKEVAIEVAKSKNLIILFDELFKGTNVKDAFDATLAVTEAFAGNLNCFFIISTHIIEVGESLMQRCNNLSFVYFPTKMNGKIPQYSYMLQSGITTDRHGMMIIENEGIVETILGKNP